MTPEVRESVLMNFYSAERRAGACPLVANERMGEFAKRFDAALQDNMSEAEFDRKLIEIATIALGV